MKTTPWRSAIADGTLLRPVRVQELHGEVATLEPAANGLQQSPRPALVTQPLGQAMKLA